MLQKHAPDLKSNTSVGLALEARQCYGNLCSLNGAHFWCRKCDDQEKVGFGFAFPQAAVQELANNHTMLVFQVQGLPRPSSLPSALRLHAAVLARLSSALGFHYRI